MGYRDEREALRVKIEELESELASARELISRLESGSNPRFRQSAEADTSNWLVLERVLPFEIDDTTLSTISKSAHERLSERGLTGRLEVWSACGRTTLRIATTLTATRMLPYAASGMVGLNAAIAAAFALQEIAHLSGTPLVVHVAWITATAGVLAGRLASRVSASRARRAERGYRDAFEVAISMAEEQAPACGTVAARVADDHGLSDETLSGPEALLALRSARSRA